MKISLKRRVPLNSAKLQESRGEGQAQRLSSVGLSWMADFRQDDDDVDEAGSENQKQNWFKCFLGVETFVQNACKTQLQMKIRKLAVKKLRQ